MFKIIFVALLMFSAGFSHSAERVEPIDSTKQCVDECFAFYRTPGPELKRCIADCMKKTAAVCETYENECERNGDGPLF